MRPAQTSALKRWLPATIALPLVTAALIPLRDHLALSSLLLIMLVVVVAIAVTGGLLPGLAASVAGVLLVVYFFGSPPHTITIDQRDNIVALAVFLVVTSAVSVAVQAATKHTVLAASSRLEADLLARLATLPANETSLPAVLGQVATIFDMTTVSLVEVGGGTVAQVGPDPVGEPALRVQTGGDLVLLAYGEPRFAEDKRVLSGLAAAAVRAVESQRLAVEAARSAELGEIDRVRAALLAAVGHDLRSPLASIKASVSTLRQSDVEWTEAEQAELLAGIENAADRLDDLVGNLLAMSRLQAGVLSVSTETVALDQVVGRAALHAGPGLVVDVPDNIDITTDPGLLERVIANLCSNALRHSHSAQDIIVRGERAGNSVRISVIDHGTGVPERDRDRIFAPFQRLGDRTTGGGTGLGLAIAKGFCEALGGSLTPSTTTGGGLTMTVVLPAQAENR